MKELEEMKKAFDEFMAKAEQTFQRMKGTAPKEILDKEEKEYLEAVISSVRDRVVYITQNGGEEKRYIFIQLYDYECIMLPYFKPNTMYKGMELGEKYTLKELGLFEGE